MRMLRVEDAVGMVLCHDITRIVPGEFKGPAFRKGHVIAPGDVDQLREIGKEHIYVWEPRPDEVHENDAAERIARVGAGSGLEITSPVEGKCNLVAARKGLLRVKRSTLQAVNAVPEIVFATRHDYTPVEAGEVVAGTRVVPLAVRAERVEAVEGICRKAGFVLEVKPYRRARVGLVTTGSEVYHGRIPDRFGPVVRAKLEAYGSQALGQTFCPDDAEQIASAIRRWVNFSADMVLVTGGMSVDPDDVTPSAIRRTGARIVGYGAPVLPGSMLMVAYLGRVPILGLPGCVMHDKATVFDLVLPRLLAGEGITRRYLVSLGYGGLCLRCPTCQFPRCAFGRP